MKKNDIWTLVVIVLVLAFLVSGIWENPISRMARSMVGNVQKYWTTPVPIKTDVPAIIHDEACALVYNYLEARGRTMTILNKRLELLDWLGKCKPLFTATYQGDGKWQVRAVGNSGYGARGQLSGAWGLWNVFEKSGVVEPANDEARELLNYIQWCTR